MLETPQTPPYPPWDPPGSHFDENRREQSCRGSAYPPVRLNPSWGPLRHPSTCRLVVMSQRRCQVHAWIATWKPAAPSHGRFTNLATTPLRHVSPPHWWLGGAQGILGSSSWAINMRGGGKKWDTTSPNDENFPSKERPLLGRLESRRVREGCISMDDCSSIRVKYSAFPI
jgi:hypothetical protein